MKPSEKALIKAKRANKQLTGNKVKKIQRRKNIANQIKAFAILGGWTAITILLWFIKPAFAAFDPGITQYPEMGMYYIIPGGGFYLYRNHHASRLGGD